MRQLKLNEDPETVSQNMLARALNQAKPEDFDLLIGAPVFPYGWYKGKRLPEVRAGFLRAQYHQGALDAYPEIKDWTEQNIDLSWHLADRKENKRRSSWEK